MTSSIAVSDVASRVDQIQQQLQQLQNGTLLDSLLNITPGTGTGATSGTDFSTELAQAQATDPTSSTDGVDQSSLASSALGSSLDTGSLGSLSGGAGLSGGVTLPQGATSMLTSSQQQFASRLSADTGLNPGVVSAWMLAEESGGAAQSRQSAGNNDWLNIGYTDSATYGSSDSVWSNPTSAANATADWLKGQDSIPGYGTASGGIQAILNTVGQSPSAQISALQNSGWASSGYPDLGSLYAQVTGS